jgi:putative DNA primase/helicase
VDKDSGEIINNETWLCSPLEVVGSGSDGAERYLVLRWRSPRGQGDITRAIPCADIGERDGWRSLKAGGVNVTTKSTFRAILADWLQQCGAGHEWIITHTTGWHHGAYIMPDGEVIGEPETPILFNGRSAASSGYAVAGTAASWRDSVARLAGGNPSMMLGVSAALSAPLIGLVGADGFGVHLFEQSSAGKTTTANIASSLWGSRMRCGLPGTVLRLASPMKRKHITTACYRLMRWDRAAALRMLRRRLIPCLTVPESAGSQRGRQPGAETLANGGDQYRGNGY